MGSMVKAFAARAARAAAGGMALALLGASAARLDAQSADRRPSLASFGYERVLRDVALLVPGGPARAASREPAASPPPPLSASQVDRVLPLVQLLHDNPFPTPRQAREVLAGLDAALSEQQKQALSRLRETAGAAGGGGRGAPAAGAAGGPPAFGALEGRVPPPGGPGGQAQAGAAARGARLRAAASDGAQPLESLRQELAAGLIRRLEAYRPRAAS